MIVSIDFGNGNIKGKSDAGKRILMPSTLEKGNGMLDERLINVVYDNNHYTLGKITANRRRDYGKYNTDYHKVMLLASIAALMDPKSVEEDVDLFVGLPIEYYLNHYKDYSTYLKTLGEQQITYIHDRKIKIKNVLVFPQSAIPFAEDDAEGYTLVIDIGAGTVDVSYWDKRSLIEAKSYNLGCMDFYKDLANSINRMDSKYNVESFLMEKSLILNPKMTTINIMGGKVDITVPMKETINGFVNKVVSKVSEDFNKYAVIDNMYLSGGGAIIFGDAMKEPYPNIIVKDDVFFNTEIYYKVGGRALDGFKQG